MSDLNNKQVGFDLANIQSVHFIGIGGIGVSAIARMFLLEGKKVTGSDQGDSLVIKELKKAGAKIKLGHQIKNVPRKCDLLVYTIAIPEDNPELQEARRRGLLTLSYPEILGLLSRQKFTIAVAGTHGKTTTTAMIAQIALHAKLDPTVIVGSLIKDIGSRPVRASADKSASSGGVNFIAGRSDLLVVEACEYRRSFLNLAPKVVAITNIDNDHLDYYKDLKDIQGAFSELVSKIPSNGYLICNPHDSKVKPILKNNRSRLIDYSQESIKGLSLLVPGKHNILDAQVALSVAKILKVKKTEATMALNNFRGTWRRFEYKGKMENGALVYDDYAHHPTEIKATILGAQELMKQKNMSGRLIIAFQPHLFSRTKMLLADFAKALSGADLIIVADIYAAREIKDDSIHAKDLVASINKIGRGLSAYGLDFLTIGEMIKQEAKSGDLVVTMGAGDIVKVGDLLL